MGSKKDIMLITSERLSGDYPRTSTKFKSTFENMSDGISVRRDSEDTNYWLNYKYAIGFTTVIGVLTYFLIMWLMRLG